MIYQPRNVYPSAVSIDGNVNNVFTMELQTNDVVSGYRLSILDFDNNEVYVGPKETLQEPLYNGDTLAMSVEAALVNMTNGANYKWRVRLYQPTYDMLITYGFVQSASSSTNIYIQPNINIRVGMLLKINNESRSIASYDLDTGLAVVSEAFTFVPSASTQYYIYSNFIDTVPDYITYARATPVVSITNVPQTLTLKYHVFEGSYVQTDNVPMMYHIFNLYMINGDGSRTLVDTSEKVYSANLKYQYDSFRTGNLYAIEMIIENNLGIVSQTELYYFDVEYEIVEYLEQPTVAFNSRQNAITASWAAPVEHYGTSEGGEVYLYNTPYNTVNSLYTTNGETEWFSADGLCIQPTEQNLTFQFCPDEHFFYDENGEYQEEAELFEGETDDADGDGNFVVLVNKNKLIFRQEPNTELEAYFYSNTTSVFVLTATGVKQINEDYIWDDTATWNDSYIWTEGGTSLERVCNHWWKVRITNSSIQIEEVYPGA